MSRSAQGKEAAESFLCGTFNLFPCAEKKYKMKKIMIILTLLISLNAFAQADMDDGDGTVPVDGGISILLLAGAAYGVKRVREHRKR